MLIRNSPIILPAVSGSVLTWLSCIRICFSNIGHPNLSHNPTCCIRICVDVALLWTGSVLAPMLIRNSPLISVVDPHHIDADPDSTYTLMRIRIRIFTLMRIQILASKKGSNPWKNAKIGSYSIHGLTSANWCGSGSGLIQVTKMMRVRIRMRIHNTAHNPTCLIHRRKQCGRPVAFGSRRAPAAERSAERPRPQGRPGRLQQRAARPRLARLLAERLPRGEERGAQRGHGGRAQHADPGAAGHAASALRGGAG